MASACRISNTSTEPFTLPAPLYGVIPPGQSIVMAYTTAEIVALAPSIVNGVKLSHLPADYDGWVTEGYGVTPSSAAPAGTGIVSVTDGEYDTPATLSARLTADAANARSALGLGAVTATGADAAAALASVGGMVDPLTTEGDIIIANATGAPIRLPISTAGYILRIVNGLPAWRELFVAGTSRPAAASTREGQWYWTTNAAAGLELAVCTHQGGTTYAWVTVPYGVTATGGALVQAADAAAARLAIGAAAGSTPLFEAGNGWSLVASQVSGTAATTYANGVDGLPGLARFTMTTSGNPTAAALNGPRIERAIAWDFAKRWRIRVSYVGVSTTLPAFGANISVWLYLRDGAGGVYAKRIVIYNWNDAPGGPVAFPPWTGGTKEFRLDRDTTILTGILSADGVWSQSSAEVLPFTPTHVGIAGEASGSGDGYIDVRDLIIESFV